LHLIDILFRHINDDARSKSHQTTSSQNEFLISLVSADSSDIALFIIFIAVR